MSMNPHNFIVSKVGEDTKTILNKMNNIVHVIGVTSREKVDLSSCKLIEVDQVSFS